MEVDGGAHGGEGEEEGTDVEKAYQCVAETSHFRGRRREMVYDVYISVKSQRR